MDKHEWEYDGQSFVAATDGLARECSTEGRTWTESLTGTIENDLELAAFDWPGSVEEATTSADEFSRAASREILRLVERVEELESVICGEAEIEAQRDMAITAREVALGRVNTLERALTEIAIPTIVYAQQVTTGHDAQPFFGAQLRAIERSLHYDTLQETNGPEGTRCEAAAREDSEDRKDMPGSDSSESE